jgi:hypothetical protein
MAFGYGPRRAPAPVRARAEVFAVGRRMFVAGAIMLVDEADRPRASLSEGAEVTIVAWRPGWAGSTRYRVRVTESGLEGWLPTGHLRGTNAASAPAPVAPPPPAAVARRWEPADPARPGGGSAGGAPAHERIRMGRL